MYIIINWTLPLIKLKYTFNNSSHGGRASREFSCRSVVIKLKPGVEVTIICKVTKSSNLKAFKDNS